MFVVGQVVVRNTPNMVSNGMMQHGDKYTIESITPNGKLVFKECGGAWYTERFVAEEGWVPPKPKPIVVYNRTC